MAPEIGQFITVLDARKMKTSDLIDAASYLRGVLSSGKHDDEKEVLKAKISELDAEIDRRVPIPND